MTDPSVLSAFQGPLRSRVGGCFPGQRAVFRGHDLHRDLADIEWLDLYVFGITGRRMDEGALRLLNAIWAYTSYPDARLWNNRVAALAGTARSTGALGISAAVAVSEAAIYGRQIDMAAAGFFVRTRQQVENGAALFDLVQEELRVNRGIAGYGRPVRRMDEDERNGPILALAKAHGLADGDYVRLAFAVEDILLKGRWRMKMNYGAMAAALVLDLGFSAQEYYLFMLQAFLAGMVPCYMEALERPEAATFALRCEQVIYEGPGRRGWNRR